MNSEYLNALKRITQGQPKSYNTVAENILNDLLFSITWINRLLGFVVGIAVGLALGIALVR